MRALLEASTPEVKEVPPAVFQAPEIKAEKPVEIVSETLFDLPPASGGVAPVTIVLGAHGMKFVPLVTPSEIDWDAILEMEAAA
ncbi:hypothetical protein AB0O34_14475 [Sphaerisporangium sp. NPDC088356]|uniref:hypothetical protein n=1 Tax=Sphaerisporangium sp. NPDC088356 TaxID=3154871 RepID=UPI0034412601